VNLRVEISKDDLIIGMLAGSRAYWGWKKEAVIARARTPADHVAGRV